MGRMLVRNVAIPGWGFLVLMEAQGFHYHHPLYIYIYICGQVTENVYMQIIYYMEANFFLEKIHLSMNGRRTNHISNGEKNPGAASKGSGIKQSDLQ
jgi:hypothetical protein